MAKIFPKYNGAKLDAERTHRYYLYRIWNKELPLLAFIGLNPSTAAEEKNDPTINKIINITNFNGYGGFSANTPGDSNVKSLAVDNVTITSTYSVPGIFWIDSGWPSSANNHRP